MSRGRGSSKSKRWVQRQNKDQFVRRAREQGYRARAVFKLEEIDKKYRLLRPETRLVDLGSAPGSWVQYARGKVRDPGQIVAIDLLEMPEVAGINFLQGDFTDPDIADRVFAALNGERVDLVLSDMAPNITGIRATDDARSEVLQESIITFCSRALRPGGAVLTKLFEGSAANWMRKSLKLQFESMQVIKPDASRAESREIFLLGKGFRPPAPE